MTDETRSHVSESASETIPQSVGLIDPQTWRPLYLSPSFDTVWGRGRETLHPDARRFLDWVHPEDRERMQGRMAVPLDGIREVEFRVVLESGRVRWLHSYATPIPDAAGRPGRVLAVVQDVTAARTGESALRRRNQQLQDMLRETRGRVEQLERERADLERSAGLARMAARIVDGINSPLAGIKNAALLMHDAVPPEHPRHRYVGLISREVERKVGRCWGLGSGTEGDPGPWEGELRNMWKPTAQEALWFQGGNIMQARFHSLHLALQLKARREGIPTPVYRHPA